MRIAPAVFDQDERDGTVVLLEPHPTGDLAPLIHEAAALCPTSAITVTLQVGRWP